MGIEVERVDDVAVTARTTLSAAVSIGRTNGRDGPSDAVGSDLIDQKFELQSLKFIASWSRVFSAGYTAKGSAL